jgi:hypothetical protein
LRDYIKLCFLSIYLDLILCIYKVTVLMLSDHVDMSMNRLLLRLAWLLIEILVPLH